MSAKSVCVYFSLSIFYDNYASNNDLISLWLTNQFSKMVHINLYNYDQIILIITHSIMILVSLYYCQKDTSKSIKLSIFFRILFQSMDI